MNRSCPLIGHPPPPTPTTPNPPCRVVDRSHVGGLVDQLGRGCQPTQKSPKNEDLFRIAYMDRPPMGTWKSVANRLGRALKTRSCYGLHTCIVHVETWKSLVDRLERALKTRPSKSIFFAQATVLTENFAQRNWL